MKEITIFNKQIKPRLILFSVSSLVAFAVDWLVYQILYREFVLAGIDPIIVDIIAYSTARVVSSVLNFYINYRFVFEGRGGLLASLIKYAINVFVILALQNVILFVLNTLLGLNVLYTPIITQVITFPINYLIQKYIVYPKNREKLEKEIFK